jgi:hypothetical protein
LIRVTARLDALIGDDAAGCRLPTPERSARHEAPASLQTFIPLQDRLSAFVQAMRAHAQFVPPGPERDELLKKAKKKAETAMEGWTNSPDLKLPK